MRYFVLCLLPFLAIFLQSTFFSFYSINGALPDLVLIFVLFYAFLHGDKKGAGYGFLCGLFEDLYMGRFIGTNALSKALTAYLIGHLQLRLFNDNILVAMVVIFLGTILNSIFMLTLSWITFGSYNLHSTYFVIVVFQTIYNLLLTVPLYIWYYNSSQQGVLRVTGD